MECATPSQHDCRHGGSHFYVVHLAAGRRIKSSRLYPKKLLHPHLMATVTADCVRFPPTWSINGADKLGSIFAGMRRFT